MSTSVIESFAASLSSLEVPLHRTPAQEATDHLEDLLVEPAVGSPIPLADVVLPDSVTRDPAPSDLEAATGITPAGPAIAEYGSVVIAGDDDGGEPVSLFAETHIAVVAASDVVASMGEAVSVLGPRVRDGLRSVVVATGPSATADMGELVYGAHGPVAVHVMLVTDR